MNLFLLLAVPLAALATHRWFHSRFPVFSDPKSWILGFIWSILALIVAALFGRWREFTGDLLGAFAGLAVTDAILVPGLVVAAWILTRPRADPWELGLWLTLVFTMAGLRDFVSTRSSYDLNELFLVPLDRILLILSLPEVVALALKSPASRERWYWFTAGGVLTLSGSLFPVLSFSGWGWVVWILVAVGITLALWSKKKAASAGSGFFSSLRTTGEDRSGRP
jgi:hypothetical protein